MTQDKIKEVLANEIGPVVYKVGMTHEEYCEDVATAVLELMRPNRLVWEEQVTSCICTSNPNYTLKYWLIEDVWVDVYTTMRRHPTLEAAQSAAQAHADEQWLASLPLGELLK